MKCKVVKKIFIMIPLFVLLISVVLFVNFENKKVILNDSKLYINEVLMANKFIIKDSDNEYSDYIELYNDYDYDIDLEGYYLSDELTSSKKWQFPNIIIKSKEYLIIYASSKDKCDLNIRECHTNFKLNKSGEMVSLLNDKGKVISKIKVPKLDDNISYSLIDNQYKLTVSTPNSVNIDEYADYNNDIDVIINEVSIKNNDSIELKNMTNKDIDLTNYFLKDKSGIEYHFKDTKIKANSYLVLYGSDIASISNNKIYLGFKINNNNEVLYLYKNNQLIDTFVVGKITENVSIGRNNELENVIYKNITIGKENSEIYYENYALSPTFSNNECYVEKGTKVNLTTFDNSEIYYTLDGSIPSKKSKKYTGEITINKNTVIRAISYKDGYIESDIVSRTYLTGRKHDLPIVSIATSNNNLFGTNGIFAMGSGASPYYPYKGANFWKDIEVPISFEYYENGQLGLSVNSGMKIFGGWSRGEAQKSLSIHFRKKYGINEIIYPFFEDNVNNFTSLVLRNSGQDYGQTKIKDAFLHKVLDGQMDIDKQDYASVVVYVNGNYYGLYNLREKTNLSYVERHQNVLSSEVDLIQGKNVVVDGSIDEYKKLLNYVKNNNMNTDEAFDYLDSQIDLQELMNYWVVETFYGQTDPANIKFYKTKDGKWRWILYDLDLTFLTSTIRWELPFSANVPGHGYYTDPTLMKNIIKNKKIRQMYIETFAYHLKNTFKPDRMIKILDEMVNDIKKEMPYHIDRWYDESIRTSQYTILSMNHWQSNINNLKSMIKYRYQNTLNTIKSGLNLTNEEYNKYFKNI